MRNIPLWPIVAVTIFASFFAAVAIAAEVDEALSRISQSDNGEEMLELFNQLIVKIDLYEDYDKLASGLENIISSKRAWRDASFLYYILAATRIEELRFLTLKNDIESGRLYMSVNDQYYAEALDSLDKASAVCRSKKLAIDIYFLKFLIYREKFQAQATADTFNQLAEAVSTYSESAEENKLQLIRIARKFEDKDLSDHALNLKIAYASKADPATAREVFEGIKTEADGAFDEGKARIANILYKKYMEEAKAYFKEEELAPKVMAIAEKYFNASRYREARSYYEFYKENFPKSSFNDYCDYRIALCFNLEKDVIRAAERLEAFLDNYKNSVWFDKAFEMLSALYYTTSSDLKAVENLNAAITKYYRKGTGDYARVLIALIYYGQKKYDSSLEELNKIELSSPYAYSAWMLKNDIESVKKRKSAPSFAAGSGEAYMTWEKNPEISAIITPFKDSDKIAISLEGGAAHFAVKPGSAVRFDIVSAEDADSFSEYMQDREDMSRLPKKLREGASQDLLSMEWAQEAGMFTMPASPNSKTWQAPENPGVYKVSLTISDFGLVRPPDKGARKDSDKEVLFVITVKEDTSA